MFFKMIMVCSFFVISQSCECMVEPSIQRSYCTSDIVAKVNVTNVTTHGESQSSNPSEYEVQYLEIFKKPDDFNKKHDSISTSGTGGLCGVEIEIKPNGTIYLLSVRGRYIDICDFNKPWDNDFKKELQAMTKFNCSNLGTPKPHHWG